MDFSSIPKALSSLFERISNASSFPHSAIICKETVLITIENLKSLFFPMKWNNEHSNQLEIHLKSLLDFGETMGHWESIAVSFYILNSVFNDLSNGENQINSLPPDFSNDFRDQIVTLLNKYKENKEHRVRSLVGKLSGALCNVYGLGILSFNKPGENMEKEVMQASNRLEVLELVQTIEKQLVREEHSFTPAPLYTSIQSKVHFDGISGWNSLESNVLLLASIIEGAGSKVLQDESLNILLFNENFVRVLIDGTKMHLNRHIREATYTILASLIRSMKRALSLSQEQESKASVVASSLSSLFRNINKSITLEMILATLELGLTDTWPQVIYAASTTTNLLLESFPITVDDDFTVNKQEGFYLESLLPHLCMNRYYVPEGVQILSQRIWEDRFHSQGKLLLTSYLNTSDGASNTIQVYNRALQALNPFTRVSALYSINELINKINAKEIQLDFLQFSENLIYTLNDEHWEVRIAACQTLASLFLSHPTLFNLNTKTNLLKDAETIKDLLVLNLFDNCWSIREAAANALVNALQAEFNTKEVEANNNQNLEPVEPEAKDLLSTKEWIFDLISTNIDKANSEQGFQNAEAYQQEKQDFYKHSGHYLVNCCGGGNHSTQEHHYQLNISDRIELQQPWFKTDATIYLVTALTKPSILNHLLTSSSPSESKMTSASLNPLSFLNKELSSWLYSISNLCLLSHFGDIYRLKCTIYDNLAIMASTLGKKYIKKYVDNFIPSLFQAVVDPLSPKLLKHSASQCIYKLHKTIGATIFVAHLPRGGFYHQELNNILSRQRETIHDALTVDSTSKFPITSSHHDIPHFDKNYQLKL